MPKFIDTRGRTKIAIAICGRCSQKFPYDELEEDPNIPGLFVCKDDKDQFDPWRLPARQTEDISLDHPRPDVGIADLGPTPLYGTNQLNPIVNNVSAVGGAPITQLRPARVWQPRTFYRKGDTIVPQDPNSENTTLPQPWIVVLEDGWSGDDPPEWPRATGVYFTAGEP
jgi:hypothetical protein